MDESNFLQVFKCKDLVGEGFFYFDVTSSIAQAMAMGFHFSDIMQKGENEVNYTLIADAEKEEIVGFICKVGNPEKGKEKSWIALQGCFSNVRAMEKAINKSSLTVDDKILKKIWDLASGEVISKSLAKVMVRKKEREKQK